jgi:hypothetical protein
MARYLRIGPVVLALALLWPAPAPAGLAEEAKCQKSIAKEGARFALRVLRSTLRCTEGISECQIQCELGVYGPSCETSPPPCCDPADTSSKQHLCRLHGRGRGLWSVRRGSVTYESSKVSHIIAACNARHPGGACGASRGPQLRAAQRAVPR